MPTDNEVGDFSKLLEVSRKWYAEHPDAAKELAGSRAADGIEPTENAAWIATLRMILNLDEFITRE